MNTREKMGLLFFILGLSFFHNQNGWVEVLSLALVYVGAGLFMYYKAGDK